MKKRQKKKRMINRQHILHLACRFLQFVISIVFIDILLSSCTGLGKLSEGQYIITKYDIDFEDKEELVHYKETKFELKEEITKQPVSKFLWMRPRVAIYNTISEPKKQKGLKHWMKYKFGKPPLLLDENYCQNLNTTFENRLYHDGHFNAVSTFDITRKQKTASVRFLIHANRVYRVDTLMLPDSEDTISNAIQSLNSNSLIKKDASYRLETLKNERERIDKELKDMGFYYFNEDYISYLVDTTDGDHEIKLRLKLKNDIPKEAKNVYSIDKILVTEDYKLENYFPDTSMVGNYQVISSSNYMKPKYFLNSILYDSGSYYSQQTHNNSLKQLMELRAYKYVTARYFPSTDQKNALDVRFLMTTSPKVSISAELNAVTKSNSFAGPGIKLSLNSKNFLRGAEFFSIDLSGRFEKQLGNEGQGDTAYEIRADANLDFPRLLPFGLKKRNRPYLPLSNIDLGAGIFTRTRFYRFNTFNAGFGYTWRKNEFLTHNLKPSDISVTDLAEAPDEFKDFLEDNASIRQSFEEQFIIGFSYNFNINKLTPEYPRKYFINVGIDPSGNLVSAIGNALRTDDKDSSEPVKVLGNPISQYFRIRGDLRYYFQTGKESIMATRLFAGVGVPYGNSKVMPYIKQFYAGGTNGIRAFRARSLGPGSYTPKDSTNTLVDQTGEIRLEGNIEYRFPITGFLKGALFSDFGNIWLVNQDTARLGGEFKFDTFYKQIAVGVGFGLRVDINLMVLRLDWAFPIRKPVESEDIQWVIDDIKFFDRNWRKDNLIWNISIGYPF